MNKIRLKQKRLFSVLKSFVVAVAVLLFIFIGVQPYIADYSETLSLVVRYVLEAFVVVILILLFLYYSKYGKADSFLTSVENEINDFGFYYTSREEKDTNGYADVMLEDLKQCGYSVNKNIEINEFDFKIKATKRKEFFYVCAVDSLNKNDVVAYLDSVIYDLTVQNIKRKGNAVLCFITDSAEYDAVSLSKMITPIGKKEQLKIALSICELSSGRVYFLGNVKTKCQQMIANFVMNCEVPIKDKFIHKDKLPFQYEIEKKMQSFKLKDFESGNFYVH